MNNHRVHLLFAAVTALCLLLLGVTLYQRIHAARINEHIAAPGLAEVSGEPLEAALARGVAQARAGDAKAAERSYQVVLQRGTPTLQRIARYNLANLQLRQAMKVSPADAQFLPQVELAKQQYRDILAADPGNWDVRYNLERALWMAPESTALQGEEAIRPEVRIPKPIMIDAGDLP